MEDFPAEEEPWYDPQDLEQGERGDAGCHSIVGRDHSAEGWTPDSKEERLGPCRPAPGPGRPAVVVWTGRSSCRRGHGVSIPLPSIRGGSRPGAVRWLGGQEQGEYRRPRGGSFLGGWGVCGAESRLAPDPGARVPARTPGKFPQLASRLHREQGEKQAVQAAGCLMRGSLTSLWAHGEPEGQVASLGTGDSGLGSGTISAPGLEDREGGWKGVRSR